MITIDLSGPDGNAFALMGYARRFGKQLGWSPDKINQIIEDMTKSDYNNLLAVFQESFQGLVLLTHYEEGEE